MTEQRKNGTNMTTANAAIAAAITPAIVKEGWKLSNLSTDAEIEKALKMLEVTTYEQSLKLEDVHFFVYFEEKDYTDPSGGSLPYFYGRLIGMEKEFSNKPEAEKKMVFDQKAVLFEHQLRSQGWTDELLDEFRKYKVAIKVGTLYYAVSPNLLITYTQRANFGMGQKCIDWTDGKQVYYMFGFLAERVRKRAQAGTKPFNGVLLTRGHVSGAEKAFACFTDRYKAIGQWTALDCILQRVTDHFGSHQVVCGNVDHIMTTIDYRLPSFSSRIKRKLPMMGGNIETGFVFYTADVGSSSIRLVPTISFNGRRYWYAMNEGVSMMHTNQADLGKFLDSIAHLETSPNGLPETKGKVFESFNKLMEDLEKLTLITVLGSAADKVVDAVASKINLEKIVGKTNAEECCQAVKCQLSNNVDYTAYDVAMAFLQVQDFGCTLEFPNEFNHSITARRNYTEGVVGFDYAAAVKKAATAPVI